MKHKEVKDHVNIIRYRNILTLVATKKFETHGIFMMGDFNLNLDEKCFGFLLYDHSGKVKIINNGDEIIFNSNTIFLEGDIVCEIIIYHGIVKKPIIYENDYESCLIAQPDADGVYNVGILCDKEGTFFRDFTEEFRYFAINQTPEYLKTLIFVCIKEYDKTKPYVKKGVLPALNLFDI